VIHISEDTYITQYQPDASHAMSSTLRVSRIDAINTELALMRFDLSSIQSMGVIGQAMLHVYVSGGDFPAQIRTEVVLAPNWPVTTTWNLIGPMTETIVLTNTTMISGWNTIDVTTLVRGAVGNTLGGTYRGFSIR